MKVAIPIAGYHTGTTGEYVRNAFLRLGHDAHILNKEEFYRDLQTNSYDLFFCVDSGETLDFSLLPKNLPAPVTMWFIDYRHNKDRVERIPNDLINALELLSRGGIIFQAQREDVLHLKEVSKDSNIHWIPMAADPVVWNDTPLEEKIYDIGFVGNIWDKARAQFLQWMMKNGLKVGFQGHGAIWKEEAAALLRRCKAGFNISTLYGTAVAYDLNMRFFETLSCGIPLITNWVPSLEILIPIKHSFIHTYRSPEEFTSTIQAVLNNQEFLSSGDKAREFILSSHTYECRMKECLTILSDRLKAK